MFLRLWGLYPPEFVSRLKALGISWFANTSTVAESKAAEVAGADVVVVQGMEAGGHRGCFDASKAERELVGLTSLVPAVVDAVRIPVVATGGLADGRGVAAALALGASAAQVGTGFLRAPESRGFLPHGRTRSQVRRRKTRSLARVFSGARGSKSGDRLRARRHFQQCATTRALPCPAWSHCRDESRRKQKRET